MSKNGIAATATERLAWESPTPSYSDGRLEVPLVTKPDEAGPAPAATPLRSPLWAAVAVAAIYASARFVNIVNQNRTAYINAYEDDAYYYFGIARSIAVGHGSTFSGLTPTNGYHPLWQLVLAAAGSVTTATQIPAAAYLLMAVLFVATCTLMLLIAHRLNRFPIGVIALVATLTVPYRLGGWLFKGMENSLLLPLLLGFLLLALWPSAHSPRRSAAAASLGAAMVLTRLDAAVVLITVAAATVDLSDAGARRESLRRSAILVAPTMISLLVYVATNKVAFGTWLPVSGLAKAVGGGGNYGEQFGAFIGNSPIAGIGMGLLFLIGTPLALLLLRHPDIFTANGRCFMRRALLVLAISQALQFAYFATTSTWNWWPWYYYLVGVQLFLIFLTCLSLLATTFRRMASSAPLFAVIAVVGFGGLSVVHEAKLPQRQSVHSDSAIIADWIATHTDPHEIVAMGDRAGVVGWYIPNPLIQLEGLTESVDYLDVLRSATVSQDMRRRGVSVYVRWERQQAPLEQGCWTFSEPTSGAGPRSPVPVCADQLLFAHRSSDGSEFTVWSFR